MDWPEITQLRDITMSPLLPGNTKGNMALRADPRSSCLQHFRYGLPESVIGILPYVAPPDDEVRVVDEPVIYGGLLFRHFGHALTESIHRLWPRFALRELHAAKVAFSLVNHAKVNPYMVEALNFHGLSKHDVIRIDEPIRFRQLWVGPQARQMAGPTLFAGYRSMLDYELSRRLPPPSNDRRLYVSRSNHHHTGSYYGESFIERLLVANGFEVVHPEDHSVTAMVGMLRASAIAVFAEGSAIHLLELCGSATPDVFVIGRRGLSIERFTPLLSDICSKWMVSDRLLFNAGMSPDFKKHSGILDLAAVVDDLSGFVGFAAGPEFEHSRALEAVRSDLEKHIADPRNIRTPDYDERSEELRQKVCGYPVA